MLVDAGIDPKTVQNRAGHASITTTFKYVHPDRKKDREAANVFDKFQ
jgi:site-specific recombinase XerD